MAILRATVGAVILALWALASGPSAADEYPSRTVRIIAPFGAGGPTDVFTRIMAQELQKTLHQPFVVENKPGAGTTLGTEYVVKSAPDGYTLLMVSGTQTVNETLYTNKAYHLMTDLVPVAPLIDTDLVLVVNPSVPAKNVAELIALAKAKPDGINYASAGTGTLMHVGMELFDSMAGIKLAHVPYNGAGPSTIAVLGGQVPVLSTSLGTALPHAKAGKLRMLAVTSAKRTPLAPEFPSVAEAAGLPGYEALTWVVLLAPAGTPPAVINKMNAEIERLQRVREVREQLANQAWDAYRDTPSAVVEFIKSEIVKWNKVIRAAGIKAE